MFASRGTVRGAAICIGLLAVQSRAFAQMNWSGSAFFVTSPNVNGIPVTTNGGITDLADGFKYSGLDYTYTAVDGDTGTLHTLSWELERIGVLPGTYGFPVSVLQKSAMDGTFETTGDSFVSAMSLSSYFSVNTAPYGSSTYTEPATVTSLDPLSIIVGRTRSVSERATLICSTRRIPTPSSRTSRSPSLPIRRGRRST